MSNSVWHTCLMPRNTAPKKEPKVLDIPALNALVSRLNAYLESQGLADATQTEKAKAIGLAHQSDARKLLAKQHAPTLERVQIISDTTKMPVWRLLMPLEVDQALQSLGVRIDGDAHEEKPAKRVASSGKARH